MPKWADQCHQRDFSEEDYFIYFLLFQTAPPEDVSFCDRWQIFFQESKSVMPLGLAKITFSAA